MAYFSFPSLYSVWFATYGTYDDPDIPPKEIIPYRLTFEAAKAEVQKLGFGYFIREAEGNG